MFLSSLFLETKFYQSCEVVETPVWFFPPKSHLTAIVKKLALLPVFGM